jgi:CO/xanthine dehydrogenase Mo-binding subunit
MDGPAPALANAIAHAIGVDVTSVPMLPEYLFELLESAHA